jgi:hypothetical protein
LKLIASSSSRRKSATPRKTIELPRQLSPLKREKKSESSGKSPLKTDRLSLESVTDNAVMPKTSHTLRKFTLEVPKMRVLGDRAYFDVVNGKLQMWDLMRWK